MEEDQLIFAGITQMWLNVQNMTPKTRKKFIKQVINLNVKNCGFIDYMAKDFLLSLIDKSKCYFND